MKAYRVTWSSIIAIILSLMMMNSCVKDLDEQWIDDPSSLMIQLNLRSGAPTEGTTSAEDPTTEPGKSYNHTKPGLDNENKLDHIAVLFYETNRDKELKWIAKPQEIKLIDSDKQLYSIMIPEVNRSYFKNKTYHIVVVANADDGDLPRLEDHSKLEDLPKKIIKKNIYVIKTKGQTKVNKPDSFVMTGEITNKTINIDERTGRYLGIVELYRLASKITCSVKVKQTTTFHMYLDETKPIEARFDNGVYNSALALPTDQTSLPDPLIRTFDKAGEPATKIQKGEYLPISYPNDQDQTIKQAFYSYLWKEGDAPKLIIKVYLKESEDATQSTAYYYELPIAKPTNDETGNRWKIMRNTWYDVNLEISTKGQLSDKDPIHINGTYIVSEWTKDQKYYNYRLYGYRYLYVPQKEIVMVSSYIPDFKEYNFNEAGPDTKTISFDTTLPDIEAEITSAYSITDDNVYEGVANAREKIEITPEVQNRFKVDNTNKTLTITDPFPGFKQYRVEYTIVLKSKQYTEFKETVVVKHLPAYSVSMNGFESTQSNIHSSQYEIDIPYTGIDQGVEIKKDTYKVTDFGGGQKPEEGYRWIFNTNDYQKKGKQLFLFRVTRAPKGTVIGYPPMDQADFYRFENIQGEDMEAVKAYDPGGGAPNTKPKVYKIDNNLPPVRQYFTKMDKNTEKMISPKFVLASMYTPSYAMRFYSGFKPDGTLARPMDREDFYHDEYRGGYVKVWDNADVRPTIRYDMKHDDYKKNTIYKDPKVKYAYVNTHLLSANILTRLSQYWETKAYNYNWKMYKEGEYENPYGAAPQSLIGLDAINVCAQYYEDVQLPNGKTKRIRNWRLPTKAELELIGSIQRNQYNVKAAGNADRMKLFKDNNIATILLDRSYFHNNGYMIFDPEILQGHTQYWSISDWGLSYTFAYPNMLQYQSWLGYYVFFVKCVHDVNRYEDESK